MPDPLLLTIERDDAIEIITLNRPDQRNALNPQLFSELCAALEAADQDAQVRVTIITGGPHVFVAGSDVRAMATLTPVQVMQTGNLGYWQRLWRIQKPMIAAVSGYAYGGGCELALCCDLIVASDTARFAQPEIKLGIMPGAGGSQRLPKAIGPYRAMEMVLTGEPVSAQEAYAWGLVNRVTPVETFLEEAKALARAIANWPPFAVRLAREALKYGVENTLRDGLEIERRNFILLFDTQEQKEGMAAFLEKRPPGLRGN
jgi:enoyl-CoA hydratase